MLGSHVEQVVFTVLNCRENNNSTAKLEYLLFFNTGLHYKHSSEVAL